MAEAFLFTKIVDMSTLYEGISIPVSFQPAIFEKFGFSLSRGEQAQIQIEILGLLYNDAIIKNQWFDSSKYPNRKDIVQIRYPRNSALKLFYGRIFHGYITLMFHMENYFKKNKSIVISGFVNN